MCVCVYTYVCMCICMYACMHSWCLVWVGFVETFVKPKMVGRLLFKPPLIMQNFKAALKPSSIVCYLNRYQRAVVTILDVIMKGWSLPELSHSSVFLYLATTGLCMAG